LAANAAAMSSARRGSGGRAGGRFERGSVDRPGAVEAPEAAIGHAQCLADRDTRVLQRVDGRVDGRLDRVGGAVADERDADPVEGLEFRGDHVEGGGQCRGRGRRGGQSQRCGEGDAAAVHGDQDEAGVVEAEHERDQGEQVFGVVDVDGGSIGGRHRGLLTR